MESLIDRTITPDPYRPIVGDIYGREPSDRVDGLPLRVVVLEVKVDPEYDAEIVVLEDGREETHRSLPAYLASIHSIAPLGRVRGSTSAP